MPFSCPAERRAGLEEVKRAVGVNHSYLDNWIYLFYENKKFDVKETIAKLNRRDIMEKSAFSTYTITPSLKKSMRSGIVQYVGKDLEGRPVLFFNTARDFPKTEERAERQANMDMFVSWTVRCARDNPTSTVTWLINQQDSSIRKNTDLIFQKDMALRISKFFPGVVARLYVCNMSTALTFVMRPLLRQLPKGISECIFMFSSSDLASGKLLEFIPENVLPVAMGGKNDCDNQENYEFFATSVETFFAKCIKALRAGITIKEMEMMEEYGVDRQGQPVASPTGGLRREGKESCSRDGSHMNRSIVVQQHGKNSIEIAPSGSRASEDGTRAFDGDEAAGRPGSSNAKDHSNTNGNVQKMHLPMGNFKEVALFPFTTLNQMNQVQRKKIDTLMTELCYYGEQLSSKLYALMADLRDGRLKEVEMNELKEQVEFIEHTAHNLLCLFPPTYIKLNYPLFAWLIESLLDYETSSQLSPLWWGTASLIDCTSPDNFLLSLQSSAVEYIDDCDTLVHENRTTKGILTRIENIWPSNLTSKEVLKLLNERYVCAWRKLVPYLQQYVECKVAMAIAEFIRFNGLLVSGGRIDCNSDWYTKLLTDMVQYREMRRRNYIFHIFPPLFRDKVAQDDCNNSPPTAEELVGLRGLKVSFRNVMRVVCLVERSMQNTLDQLASPVTVNIAARNVVEHYLEDTMRKIYITYESQRSGLFPQELATQKQSEALRCLEAAQAPLTDFLFALASISWVKDRESRLHSSNFSWQSTSEQLNVEQRKVEECICIRERSRLLANGIAAAAYNLQGTFSRAPFSSEVCTQEPPEGHAAALSLLFVAAAICQLHGSSSFVHDDASSSEADVKGFLKILTNLHKSTAAVLSELL